MSIKDMAAAIIGQVEKGIPIDPDAAAAVAAWAQEAAKAADTIGAPTIHMIVLLNEWHEGAK